MRREFIALCVGACLLLWAGFRLDGLPFTPSQTYSDAVTSHFPAAIYFRQSVAEAGVFPIWRENFLAGHPFAANPLNKTAYPFQWFTAVLPPLIYLNAAIVAHLVIAAVGMGWWARLRGLGREAILFAALSYALSPRLIAHLGGGHLDVLYALAWLPWLMASIEHIVSTPRVRFRGALFVGLCGSLLVLADVRVSFFGFAAAALFAMVMILQKYGWRRLPSYGVWFGISLVCIGILTSSVWIPLLVWSPYLSRAALTATEAGIFSMQPLQWLGLILAPQSGNLETLPYLGLTTLIMALLILGAQPRRYWLWGLLCGLAMLYALGSNGALWSLLTTAIPPLLWFRVPARAWLIMVLVLPLLAGHGLQHLLSAPPSRKPSRLWFISGAALLSMAVVILLLGILPQGMAVGLTAGSGVCFLLAFRYMRSFSVRWLIVASFLFLSIDLVYNGKQWLEWRSESLWLSPTQRALAETLIEDSAARVYSPTYSLEQQTVAAYDLDLFGGIDPFQIQAIADAVSLGGGIESSGYSVVTPPLLGMDGDQIATANRQALPDTRILGQWGVTHVVSAYPLAVSTLALLTRISDIYVYVNRDDVRDLATRQIPAWAPDWQTLPDTMTVQNNNRATEIAAFTSIVGLVMLALILRPNR